MSPPPQYSLRADTHDSKVSEPPTYGNTPWLLKRTSITVESTCRGENASTDQLSTYAGTKGDKKLAIRSLIKNKLRTKDSDNLDDQRSLEDSPYDFVQFGTVVSIEASQPTQRRYEMKGLEQATNMKRWVGNGQPAEAWGKLVKVSSGPRCTMYWNAHIIRIRSSGIHQETL